MTRFLPALLLALAACPASKPRPPPEPGPLRAGVATVPLDVPVGVPTGGYSKARRPGDAVSPWAEEHPATVGVQTQPSARAIALSDGVTEIVLVRLDLCLTTATLRWRAQSELEASGHDVALLLTSTHTHSAPARYFHPAPAEGSGGIDPTKVAMDSFDAEVEGRLARSIASAAAQALDSMKPASMGVATVAAGQLNRDRRCENDDLYGPGFRDQTMTVVRLDEVDEAGTPVKPLTGLVHFAIHGTVLGSENRLFSTDAPGAIELFASDAVGVPLLFLQGAAGDVSPSTGGLGHDDFQGTERIGHVAARLVKDAWDRAVPPSRPARATLSRFELPVDVTREAIGYARGEFAEYGAVACGFGGSACPPMETEPKSVVCLPLKRRPFSQTTVEALRLENVLVGTLPGEPTTAIGERVKAAGAQVAGVTHVLTAGYAQDHFGYLLEEKDYLRLGYEPSVSPWGWRFGGFITGKLGEAFAALGTTAPAKAAPAEAQYTPRAATDSTGAPSQVGNVADLRRLDSATFAFEGGDAALGTPRVSLEREGANGFEPVPASPVRFVAGGPDIVLFYEPSPSWADSPSASSRAHRWRALWETLTDTPAGRYRLVAEGRARLGGVVTPYVVQSNTFTLEAARSAGSRASAELSADGALTATFRFPPNPTVTDAQGTVSENFRLRDEDASPGDGARVRGGSATGTLTLPDASTRGVTLTWDAARSSFVASGVPVQAGTYSLEVLAGGLTDTAGNTNGAPVTVTFTR